MHSIRTLYPNKIIVSNKLLGLSRLGLELGFGSGSFYMQEMTIPVSILELLNVVTNNLLGYNVRIGWPARGNAVQSCYTAGSN